jgi:hypothetical protein
LGNTVHLAEACTFFERQDKVEVGDLSPDATRVAYLEPLAASGVGIDSDALALLVSRSGGYPFAIQLYGRHAWDQAGAGGHITIERAARAIEEADRWLARPVAGRRRLVACPALAGDDGSDTWKLISGGFMADAAGVVAHAAPTANHNEGVAGVGVGGGGCPRR